MPWVSHVYVVLYLMPWVSLCVCPVVSYDMGISMCMSCCIVCHRYLYVYVLLYALGVSICPVVFYAMSNSMCISCCMLSLGYLCMCMYCMLYLMPWVISVCVYPPCCILCPGLSLYVYALHAVSYALGICKCMSCCILCPGYLCMCMHCMLYLMPWVSVYAYVLLYLMPWVTVYAYVLLYLMPWVSVYVYVLLYLMPWVSVYVYVLPVGCEDYRHSLSASSVLSPLGDVCPALPGLSGCWHAVRCLRLVLGPTRWAIRATALVVDTHRSTQTERKLALENSILQGL